MIKKIFVDGVEIKDLTCPVKVKVTGNGVH